ncbi:MAG: glycoside hydrolase family 13 protein [Clostridia bacterium]|nr:glycoside hydrolase family 13 protein [Clostridia bacterium]
MEFNSRDLKFKTPFGCVRQGENITINTLASPDAKVSLIIEKNEAFYTSFDLSYSEKTNMHTVNFTLDEIGLYYYYFAENGNFIYKNGSHKWQILCYRKDFDTPDCMKGKIMYQIFPDRFYKEGDCDLTYKHSPFWQHQSFDDVPEFRPDILNKIPNNDFFGGNLNGIKAKLPYLKELGVDIIYLNPIFKAFSNHRYDTADYLQVDPMLGTNEDFKELCSEAHKLDIKIILDGVFSHTGETSIYFDKYDTYGNGAYNHPDSPYISWYDFQEYPKKYTSWWGIDILPCVKEMDENYRNFIINGKNSVITTWQENGADGYRLDVADELPDEFIEELYKKVKKNNKEAIVLGEVWEDASNKISYGQLRKYLYGSELDSVMNYVYKEAIINFALGHISAKDFCETVESILENYPEPYHHTLMNMLSTHDTPRIMTVMGGRNGNNMTKEERAYYQMNANEYALGKTRMFFSVFLQFALPGMPSVYYGDEIGMQGYEDPFNRGFFKWNSIDEDIHNYYKGVIAFRKKYKALQLGSYETVYSTDKTISFKRKYKNEELLMVVNISDEIFRVKKEGKIAFEKNCEITDDEHIHLYKYGVVAFEL